MESWGYSEFSLVRIGLEFVQMSAVWAFTYIENCMYSCIHVCMATSVSPCMAMYVRL